MARTRAVFYGAIRTLVCAAAVLLADHVAAEAPYPARPITFIVPWGVGGGSDQVSREIARRLEEKLKVSVIVLNAPGANGTIGISKLVNAPADGYTLALMAADTYALLAASDPPTQWNDSQLIPLAVMIKQTNAIIVAADSPYKSWDDLVAAVKKKPETVSIAVGGAGSPQDLTINSLRTQGTQITVIPYANPGERYSAVLGHQIDGFYEALGNVKGFLDSHRMRPLLMFAPKRVNDFPDVSTSVEAGISVTLPQFRAVVVKQGTDSKIVKLLYDAMRDVAATNEYKRYLASQFADPDSYVPGAEASKFMHDQLIIMKELAKSVGKSS